MAGRVAYLVNQYPKVSHSFIRTEILELERQGLTVDRIAVRGWDAEVVDPLDATEQRRTRYVLQHGARPLLTATLQMALLRPAAFLSATKAAWRLSRGGERGFLYHLIYLAEACLVAKWLGAAASTHVHAHFGSNATTVALLIRALGGPPYSFTVHGPEEFDKPLQLKLRDKIRHAAFVVGISNFCRSQLYRWADPCDWTKIEVVHCTFDPRFTAFSPSSPAGHQMLCIGRLCEQKGQLLLVEAVAAVSRRGVDVRLVLAGDGPMREDLERAIAAAGLHDRIEITGWIDVAAVQRYLEQSRVLVLPSFAEGLPIAIMEAMACHRPVLTTYIAGIPELVRDGIDGLLIPAGDVDALADAITCLLARDDQDIAAMGAAAARRASERHSASTEIPKLAELFRRSAAALSLDLDP